MKIISDYPINEKIIRECAEILKDYDVVISERIKQDSEKIYLSDSTHYKCRFCGKSYPDVKFKNHSHTIPEFMGNKKLFSKYECDTCNSEYFNLFENEMANFMLPHNALSGIKVKNNKIPKYHLNGNPIIRHEPDKISISEVPNTILKTADKNSIDLPIKVPTYIPEYIYRCLVKIGLSIIPEKNLNVYKGTIDWLMNKDIPSNIEPFVLFSMYPYELQMDEIVCSLLERKDECMKNIPHSILFLSYNNFAFQTCMPHSSKEKLSINMKAIPFIYPTSIDLNKNHENTISYNMIDLSSKEKKSNEIFNLIISGERNLE